jgi:hypothetical protein
VIKTRSISRFVFPTGASLTVAGVVLYAALEKHSFESTGDWLSAALEVTFLPALVMGILLVIIGAAIDRKRMSVATARRHGLLCLVAAGVSFALLNAIGDVHSWTFSFFFPAWAGLLAGVIYLTKFNDVNAISVNAISEDTQR